MRIDRLLALLLCGALVASGFILLERARAERTGRSYEVTGDYAEFQRFSAETGKSLQETLVGFKNAGLNSVNIAEATIESLKNEPGVRLSSRVEGDALLLEGDPSVLEFIEKGLRSSLSKPPAMRYQDPNTLVVPQKSKDILSAPVNVSDQYGNRGGAILGSRTSKMEFVGLGFLEEQIDRAKEAGFAVVLRPIYSSEFQDPQASLARFGQALDRFQTGQKYILFAGGEALGVGIAKDGSVDSDAKPTDGLVAFLKERQIAPVMVENAVQRGHLEMEKLDSAVRDIDYQALRAFTTWDFIQRRYDYGIPMHRHGQEIMNTYFRAITERNIRLIYFRPFIGKNKKVIDNFQIYQDRLQELKNRLSASHGFANGPLQPMKFLSANRILQWLAALGVLAGGFMLLQNLFALPRRLFYGLLGGLSLLLGVSYMGGVGTESVNKLMAFAATVIFPCLALLFVLSAVRELLKSAQAPSHWQRFGRAVVVLLMGCLIALSGAALEASFLAHSRYLLEMDAFSGVKLSQFLPLGLSLVLYLAVFGYKRSESRIGQNGLYFSEVRALLEGYVKVWHGAALLLVAGVLFMLISRGGHEGNVEPISLELLTRNFFEYYLIARPRNKSMFLAFPAAIGFVWLAFGHKLRFAYPVLAMLTVIGFSDILNTFSHLRTPLYLSVARTFYAFILGAGLIGLMGALFLLGLRLMRRRHA